ncbi:MAG: hypothetical protein HUU15_01825 [Candidatus Brocadiae bacterium]|nr:hypothetical protein [Candidatus Brocadiia bacterium]
MDPAVWQQPWYLIRRKVLKLFGGAFHIYLPDGRLGFYCKMAAFKLKEDIRLYSDEGMQEELLTIKARQILDFGATYDVVDAPTGQLIGSLRRRAFKSILRDEWDILAPGDQPVGQVIEDSTMMALLRRFLSNLIPQGFTFSLQGRVVAELRQNFNPFVLKITADFSGDPQFTLDRRIGIAAGILMAAIEGRQG